MVDVTKITRLLGEGLIWSVFLIVILLVLVSGGRILDPRIAIDDGSAAVLVVTAMCWIILVAVLAKLAVGNWQHKMMAKRALVAGFSGGLSAWAVSSFFGEAVSETLAVLLVGLLTVLGCIVADRIFHLRVNAE